MVRTTILDLSARTATSMQQSFALLLPSTSDAALLGTAHLEINMQNIAFHLEMLFSPSSGRKLRCIDIGIGMKMRFFMTMVQETIDSPPE